MKIALLFPGYNARLPIISKDIYENNRIVQEYLEEASNCLNLNAIKLCFSSSSAELAGMESAYTALFITGCALYKVLANAGIIPALLVGHNTGVYSALFAAAAINFPDGLYLLVKYAIFYKDFIQTTPIKIARVSGMAHEELVRLCESASTIEQQVQVSVFYTNQEHDVCGHASAVNQLIELIGLRANVQELLPAYGIHTPLTDSVADMMSMYLQKVDVKNPQLVVLSESEGRLVTTEQESVHEIIACINRPLYVNRLFDVLMLHDIIVHMGPESETSALFKKIHPAVRVICIAKQSDIDGLVQMISSTTASS